MGYGLGIFLIAVGLILSLGVRDRLTDFDLTTIGWILTGVGVLSILLTLLTTSMRTRRRTEIIDRREDPDEF